MARHKKQESETYFPLEDGAHMAEQLAAHGKTRSNIQDVFILARSLTQSPHRPHSQTGEVPTAERELSEKVAGPLSSKGCDWGTKPS